MANLTIRGVDDITVEALKLRAKSNHRSLESEVRLLLEQHAQRKLKKELLAQAEAVAGLTLNVPQTDSTMLIRESRSA